MGYQDLIGKKAPSFSLLNYDGKSYEVKPGETGRPLVVYFYPHAGGMGCTLQACSIRDAIAGDKPVWKSDKMEIVGISPDTVEKQKWFVEKHNLTFPMLSDEKGTARELYQVGKGAFGLAEAARVTFVIDKDGIVKDALEATINFASHKPFIEKWLTKLGGGTAEGVKAGKDQAETPAPTENP